MAHAQKPDFVFRRNERIHLNRRGRQFSQLLAAEVCASAVVMLDTPCSEVVWRVWLPTPFASFPFTSPTVRHRVPSHFNSSLPLQHTVEFAVKKGIHRLVCQRATSPVRTPYNGLYSFQLSRKRFHLNSHQMHALPISVNRLTTLSIGGTYMNICFLLQEAMLRPRTGFSLPIRKTIDPQSKDQTILLTTAESL